MAQVNVTIAGKSYRMACGEGEESRLTALAAGLDARIAELRETFGEIGDMRLQVMAALMLADEFSELKTRLATLEADVARLNRTAEAGEARLVESVTRAVERVERLTRSLSAAPDGARPD